MAITKAYSDRSDSEQAAAQTGSKNSKALFRVEKEMQLTKTDFTYNVGMSLSILGDLQFIGNCLHSTIT